MMNDINNSTPRWPLKTERLEVQQKLNEALADAIDAVQAGCVAPPTNPAELRCKLGQFDFKRPIEMLCASGQVIELLQSGMVHMMHPAHFGLFNPSVAFPGVLADQIAAHFNPQLAVWSHAPAAVEIERHTIEAMGGLVGWSSDETSGHFTSGGAEANYSAVLMALTKACPEYAESGATAFGGTPCIYVSAESHLAWLKIAHQAGIGRTAVRLIPTDGMGRLDVKALETLVSDDVSAGNIPVFMGATAGTTNAGMIDPLSECHAICRDNDIWFHVDAAWGGAGLLNEEAARHLKGIKEADSITLDAHKWFAVPMGAGIFLCRDEGLLGETFRVAASYMPESTEDGIDPYTHSLQWSRRFIGLKLFMSLACMGWDGYRRHVGHALRMADRLKSELGKNGWRIENDSPLAVICFVDGQGQADPVRTAADVVESGRAWLSSAKFEGQSVLRACITSHFTREEHIGILVDELNRSRVTQCR
ncbi:MAG: pyridoxal phosphate-dependent decarboxylase family protein [Rhizobiaceae bacterium]